MLSKIKKQNIIKKYRTHKGDTGSTEVQIAILTEEIKELTSHLRENKKDYSSRRGLLAKVSLRHKLLRYLEREDDKKFAKLVKALKLKVAKKVDVDLEEDLIKKVEEVEEDEKVEDKK